MRNESNLDILQDQLEELLRKEADKVKGLPLALSGGVDSSLLAALAEPRYVVSVGLPVGKHNETDYSKKVADHLGIEQIIIYPDDDKFDNYFEKAVRAIGRPIPHFNIFPLYCMYEYLSSRGELALVLGDGPDETMCGYGRNLIMEYLYRIYNFDAFETYKPTIDKVLPNFLESYLKVLGKEDAVLPNLEGLSRDQIMCRLDMDLMRPDMDDMSNKIAESFGITNIRPYQDNQEVDNFMYELPLEAKIHGVEYGKYLLRRIAEKYLPKEIAWRKAKVGGPVFNVNIFKGWDKTDGEFGKKTYLEKQQKILNNDYN